MPHAHHFLSRLDRISPPHVEVALSLYNDVPMLRFILESVTLPEAASRVAISLVDRDRGPFLVVTRDGHFVTCLGEGMSAGELPVIGRSHLDALAARASDFRDRLELANTLTGNSESGTRRLHKRIFESGGELSREEFTALVAWRPVMMFHWVGVLFDVLSDMSQARESVIDIGPDPTVPERELLHAYWNAYWSVCHLGLLIGSGGVDVLDCLSSEVQGEFLKKLSWGLTRQGVAAGILRGGWLRGRLGKVTLPACKEMYREAGTLAKLVDATVSLTAIGVRHSKLTAEVRKLLTATPRYSGGPLREEVEIPLRTNLAACASAALDARDQPKLMAEIDAAILEAGRDICVDVTKHRADDPRRKFVSREDVSDDVARAMCMNHLGSYFREPVVADWTLLFLARAAVMRAEDFFFPKNDLERVPLHFRPHLARGLVAGMRGHYGVRRGETVRVEKTCGRNDPCHCGSGKKFKKCHGT